jgi:CDP-6-deoxy-D-xylo-4-hexulose-3-dehydrase
MSGLSSPDRVVLPRQRQVWSVPSLGAAARETTERVMVDRVLYAQSVHDQSEIDAVVRVLTGGPTAMRPGPNVAEMERQIAALYGKSLGVMCNSGSSALYLAVELLDLPRGAEVITSPLTFSTDIAPIVRTGCVPAFVDVEPDTFNVDVARIEEMITPRTKALLFPNLIGNAPDWDAIRALADRHGLKVIEDSCDALGLTLRGTPTGTRSDITVTSFAMAHIITCAGNGGMVTLDDDDLRDRCLMLRRWGRRSEKHLFGTRGGGRVFREDLDGIPYDNDYIFDLLPWNFEPSELGAAFGLEQLKKLDRFTQIRRHNFDFLTEVFGRHRDRFVLPRQTEGVETAWLCYPVLVRPEAGFHRSDLQEYLDRAGIDNRTVWTGNATRQPMMKGVEYRQPVDGLPNSDRVMESGMLLSASHGTTQEELDYMAEHIEKFLTG